MDDRRFRATVIDIFANVARSRWKFSLESTSCVRDGRVCNATPSSAHMRAADSLHLREGGGFRSGGRAGAFDLGSGTSIPDPLIFRLPESWPEIVVDALNLLD